MSLRFRPISLLWTLVPVCAVGFLLWLNTVRIERLRDVAAQPDWSVDLPAEVGTSPTGYAGGTRRHLVPGPNQPSYDWIAQTQQMLATRAWRLQRVTYDNAPYGSETHLASPYRWWLGLVARIDRAASGKPLGISVERAALVADPLLHALALIGAALFARWQLGRLAGVVAALAVAALFPFATGFLAGAPSPVALAQVCGLGSLLLLLPGLRTGAAAKSATRWWFAAGAVNAASLWIQPLVGVTLAGGVAAGGLLTAWLARRSSEPPLPWRAWAAGGAAATLAAVLIEYFPAGMDPARLEVVHPLYGLTWLAAGGLLEAVSMLTRAESRQAWRRRETFLAVASAGVFAAGCALFMVRESGFWNTDPLGSQLTGLGDGIAAPSLASWLQRDGFGPAAWATLLPLVAAVAGLAVFWRQPANGISRGISILVGGAVVALVAGSLQLRSWLTVDCFLVVLLAMLAGVAALRRAATQLMCIGVLAVALWPGVRQSLPAWRRGAPVELTAAEVRAVIHRDLAHWLALRSAGTEPIVFASPELTTSLIFHGGLRGISTLRWENRDGFLAAARIASATSVEEAQTLLQRREVRYLVLPTWDAFLDEYVTLGLNAAAGSKLHERSLVASLRRWALPPWLRALPYSLPPIAGYDGAAVQVFEVREQPEPLASSRLAEYFVETSQFDLAAAVRERLLRYPNNLGALVARAQVERARGDDSAFERSLDALARALERGGDRRLPWDRRVSLAVVLAQARRTDPAREQLNRCLAEMNATELRTLTTGALFRLLALCRLFKVEIADPEMRELAHALLPPELRQRLAG